MSATRHCRHCGDAVPHDAPSAVCGRCACLPVAERGQRQPGCDDDRRPTRCLTCGLVGSGETCPRCLELLSDIGEVAEELATRDELAAAAQAQAETLKSAPAPETEAARRARIHAARVASVRASWIRGQRCLLARALDPSNQEWARCEPRGVR